VNVQQFTMYDSEEASNYVASVSTTGECAKDAAATSTTAVAEATITEEQEQVIETASAVSTIENSASTTTSGSSATDGSTSQETISSSSSQETATSDSQETNTSIFQDGSGDEKKNDESALKEGVSVGVLGVLLFAVVSFGCILARRGKARSEKKDSLLMYTQQWAEYDGEKMRNARY
jgi:cobalamin biosynthesis Mg chelatase CobN